MRRLLLGAGSIAVIGLLAFLAARVTLVALLVVAVPHLGWTALRRPTHMTRRSVMASLAALVLALLPFDVWFIQTGDLDMGFAKVAWGLYRPLPDSAGADVLSGGCARPLLNPARHAVWISY